VDELLAVVELVGGDEGRVVEGCAARPRRNTLAAACWNCFVIGRRRLFQVEVTKAELSQLVERAQHLDPSACDPRGVCHLIASTT